MAERKSPHSLAGQLFKLNFADLSISRKTQTIESGKWQWKWKWLPTAPAATTLAMANVVLGQVRRYYGNETSTSTVGNRWQGAVPGGKTPGHFEVTSLLPCRACRFSAFLLWQKSPRKSRSCPRISNKPTGHTSTQLNSARFNSIQFNSARFNSGAQVQVEASCRQHRK